MSAAAICNNVHVIFLRVVAIVPPDGVLLEEPPAALIALKVSSTVYYYIFSHKCLCQRCIERPEDTHREELTVDNVL